MAALSNRIDPRDRHHGLHRPVGQQVPGQAGSELDKPRGFAVIGMAEAKSFLRDKPVGMMRGAGKVAAGATGARRHHAHRAAAGCRSQDPGRPLWRHRPVAVPHGQCPGSPRRRSGRRDEDHLVGNHLQQRPVEAGRPGSACCGARPSGSAPAPSRYGLGGKTVVLKLKTADFRLRTRSTAWNRRPSWPTASSAPRRWR